MLKLVNAQVSDKTKRYLLKKKKKTEAILFRTGRKTFLFSLYLAVERDSTLSVVYLHARARYRSRNFAGREKTKRNEQPERSKEKEREREGLLEYILKSGFPCASRDYGRKIRKAEETKRPGRKRSRYFAERKTRDHGFCRGECIPH